MCLHSCSLYGNKLIIFGGEDKFGNYSNDLYEYDIENKDFRRLKTFGDVPTPRIGHDSKIVNDYLYIFGGTLQFFINNSIGSCKDTNLYEFDFLTKKWKKYFVNNIGERCFFSSLVYNNEWYIFGKHNADDHVFVKMDLKKERTIILDENYNDVVIICINCIQ